jgi:hypothetical protein
MSQLANLMKGMSTGMAATNPTATPSAVTKGGRRRKRKSVAKAAKAAGKGTRKSRKHRRVKKSRVNWFF